jgi:hypothetical protein
MSTATQAFCKAIRTDPQCKARLAQSMNDLASYWTEGRLRASGFKSAIDLIERGFPLIWFVLGNRTIGDALSKDDRLLLATNIVKLAEKNKAK